VVDIEIAKPAVLTVSVNRVLVRVAVTVCVVEDTAVVSATMVWERVTSAAMIYALSKLGNAKAEQPVRGQVSVIIEFGIAMNELLL
jgi:hypothetical protein